MIGDRLPGFGAFAVSGSWLRDFGGVSVDEGERAGLELAGVGELVEGRVGAGGFDRVAASYGELVEQALSEWQGWL